MVFDRLRSVFTGQPAGPSRLIRDALLPIRAVSEPLWERSARFVHDGSASEVLLELDAAHQPDLERLMLEPAKLVSWRRALTDDQLGRLKRSGFGAEPSKEVPEFRSRLTAATPPRSSTYGWATCWPPSAPARTARSKECRAG